MAATVNITAAAAATSLATGMDLRQSNCPRFPVEWVEENLGRSGVRGTSEKDVQRYVLPSLRELALHLRRLRDRELQQNLLRPGRDGRRRATNVAGRFASPAGQDRLARLSALCRQAEQARRQHRKRRA
jgi:hypothetical protein